MNWVPDKRVPGSSLRYERQKVKLDRMGKKELDWFDKLTIERL
jgi:hypothetical protein